MPIELDTVLLGTYNDFDNFLLSNELVFQDQDDIFGFDYASLVTLRDEMKRSPLCELEQLRNFIRRTTCYHELKHFHDSISTSMGIERKLIYEARLRNILSVWPSVCQEKVLKVPFSKWVDQVDCPESVRTAFRHYDDYYNWLRKWYAAYPVQRPRFTVIPESGIKHQWEVLLLEDDFPVPCLSVMVDGQEKLFVIGTRAIVEGMALAYQIALFGYLFQPRDNQIFIGIMDDFPLEYTVTMVYMRDQLGYLAYEVLFAASFVALMGSKNDKSIMDRHPGFRFVKAVETLKAIDFTLEDPPDMDRLVTELVTANGWTPLKAIYEEYATFFGKTSEALADIQQGDAALTRIISETTTDKVVSTLKLLASILPGTLGNILTYIEMLNWLPHPNIYAFRGKTAIITDPKHLSILKFFLSNMVTDLMVRGNIVCPYKRMNILCDEKTPDCERAIMSKRRADRFRWGDVKCVMEHVYLSLGLYKVDLKELPLHNERDRGYT